MCVGVCVCQASVTHPVESFLLLYTVTCSGVVLKRGGPNYGSTLLCASTLYMAQRGTLSALSKCLKNGIGMKHLVVATARAVQPACQQQRLSPAAIRVAYECQEAHTD